MLWVLSTFYQSLLFVICIVEHSLVEEIYFTLIVSKKQCQSPITIVVIKVLMNHEMMIYQLIN